MSVHEGGRIVNVRQRGRGNSLRGDGGVRRGCRMRCSSVHAVLHALSTGCGAVLPPDERSALPPERLQLPAAGGTTEGRTRRVVCGDDDVRRAWRYDASSFMRCCTLSAPFMALCCRLTSAALYHRNAAAASSGGWASWTCTTEGHTRRVVCGDDDVRRAWRCDASSFMRCCTPPAHAWRRCGA